MTKHTIKTSKKIFLYFICRYANIAPIAIKPNPKESKTPR